eukprot:CAMPEP_0181465010 /NCGR_PEP_ID=MMETSP1110-20121109/35729_1 /TAXON_ID=174948 /ORGANISM="Symbiodinium sp., Strain CCMP421" /LENGTH=81 /DNA_ID=CAMNT_0023589765 /DNA_START=352 /DNA_END=597 /DNA_ORIENTATION=-
MTTTGPTTCSSNTTHHSNVACREENLDGCVTLVALQSVAILQLAAVVDQAHVLRLNVALLHRELLDVTHSCITRALQLEAL